MLDRNFVRTNLDFVRKRLSTRGGDYSIDELVSVDAELKKIVLRTDDLRRQRSEASEAIGRLKKSGQDTSAQQSQVKEISAEIRSLEETSRPLEERLHSILHGIPNLPHETVPVGSDETANAEVRRWGTAPSFDFAPLA